MCPETEGDITLRERLSNRPKKELALKQQI